MKLLLTGSAGFVFSNMVLYFQQHTNHNIVSIDKLTDAGSLLNLAHNADVNNSRHKFYLGDIADYDFIAKIFDIERPDIVINGAAHSHVDNSIKSSQDFVRSNVIGVHSILEAMRNVHMPKKFIQFGTDEEYGQIISGSFDENSKLSPRNPYSATKASGSLLCQSYIETYDFPVIITRCCNIFGNRQNKEKFIPKCITNLLQNKKCEVFGKGLQKREWIFIKDVFHALQTIIKDGVVKEVYNIGTGYEVENIVLAKKILNIMGYGEKMIEFIPDRLGHDFRYSLNCEKLHKLGWSNKYKFDEALEHTIGWYKNNWWSWK